MKHLLLKTWLMLCLLVFGVGTTWADHTLVKANDMVSGEKYIITAVYNKVTYYLAPASFSAGDTGCGTYTTDLTEAAAWTFTKSGSNWTISTDINGTKYYLSHTNANNGVQSTTTSGNYTIAASTTGANTVKLTNNSRVLALYQGSNWRCYTSSSGVQTITLYKVNSSTPSYALTFANNSQGTFSAKVDGNTVTSGSKVEAGKTVTLTADPKDGYVFNAWNVYKTANQHNIITVSESNTFTMPSEAVTVDAYFIEGKTIPNVEVSLAAGTYRGAQSVTITNFDEDEYAYYYTLDGTTPAIDEAGVVVGTTQEYTGPISISESCTLSILTTDFEDSKVNTFAYVIEYPYTVTIEEPVNGTLTVMNGETPVKSGDKFYKGETITATANPAEGYKFRMLQFTDATNHNFTASNVKEWNMGDHDVTISATFDEIKYYTVAFSVNGTIVQSDVLEENTTISVPAVGDINGKKFVGWSEKPTVSSTTGDLDAPSAKTTKTVTYYAVFATVEGTGEPEDKTITLDFVGDDWGIPVGSSNKIVDETSYSYGGYTIKLAGNSGNGFYMGTLNSKPAVLMLGKTGAYLKLPVLSTPIKKVTCLKSPNSSVSTTVKWNVYAGENKASTEVTGCGNGAEFVIADAYQNSELMIKVTNNYNTQFTGIEILTEVPGYSYSEFTTNPYGNTVTISAAKYATFYNAEHAVVMPDGVTGYTFTAADGLQKAYASGETIPADVPVVVGGEAGTYPLNYTTGGTAPSENDLCGAATNMTADDMASANEGKSKFYALSLNSRSELSSVGFYWVNDGGAAFDITAGKAYLALPASIAISAFTFGDDEDAITNISANSSNNGEIFNLAGQRVEKAVKGLYIVNGKKVLVK